MKRILIAWLAAVALAGCISSGDRPLRFLSGEGATYPESARAQRIEGYVVVRYDVAVDGVVTNATVVESVPPGVFDEAALAAVRAWRFAAPTLKGEPQPAPARTSRLDFRLDESEDYEVYER
jgi:TonB family protein